MQEHHSLNNNNSHDDRLNIREQLDKYVIHWKWFLLSVVVCLIAALLYLRYTIPQYSASATILVKDERKGGIQSELSAFSDLGLVKSLKNNVDNEIEIIKSRNIISSALKKLNLNVIAEGIETQHHWDVLKRMHCDEGQGFFIAHPMLENALDNWLNNWKV